MSPSESGLACRRPCRIRNLRPSWSSAMVERPLASAAILGELISTLHGAPVSRMPIRTSIAPLRLAEASNRKPKPSTSSQRSAPLMERDADRRVSRQTSSAASTDVRSSSMTRGAAGGMGAMSALTSSIPGASSTPARRSSRSARLTRGPVISATSVIRRVVLPFLLGRTPTFEPARTRAFRSVEGSWPARGSGSAEPAGANVGSSPAATFASIRSLVIRASSKVDPRFPRRLRTSSRPAS